MKYETIAEFRLYDLGELEKAAVWFEPDTVLVSALRERAGGIHPTPVALCSSLSKAHRMVERWLRDADRHAIAENGGKREDECDYGICCSEYLMDRFPFINDDDFTVPDGVFYQQKPAGCFYRVLRHGRQPTASISSMIGAFDIVCFKDGIVLGREKDHVAICIHDL